jgi:hypothetical protein
VRNLAIGPQESENLARAYLQIHALLDVALLHLSDQVVAKLEGMRFLRLDDISFDKICRRAFSPLAHVDIIDGKLWIQTDNTEHGIAPVLVEA